MRLFSYNLIFKKEKKKDIVFFDKNFAKLKIKNFSYHYFDYKSFNFYVLLKSLPEVFKINDISFKYIYLKNFLEMISPSVVVGHNFNNIIYKVKRINSNIKTIIYLHNRLYLDQINQFKKEYSKIKSDFFFVCDNLHKKKLSNFISSKFIINGLTKNNEIEVNKKRKKFDLMIISEFRDLPENHFYSKSIKNIAKIISDYAKVNNLKVLVALNSSRKEKNFDRLKEINFFQEVDNKFYFNKKNSYQNAEESKLIICLASNLGADLLARGYKVLFLPFLANYSEKYKSMYLKKNSEFVHKHENFKEITKKIDNLLKIKKNTWEKTLIKSNMKFIYDKKNTIMKKIIKKIIEDDRKIY